GQRRLGHGDEREQRAAQDRYCEHESESKGRHQYLRIKRRASFRGGDGWDSRRVVPTGALLLRQARKIYQPLNQRAPSAALLWRQVLNLPLRRLLSRKPGPHTPTLCPEGREI